MINEWRTKHGHVKSPQRAFHPVVFCTGPEGFVELRKAALSDSIETLKFES